MKILLTGSSGMLGREICKCFINSYKIIGLDIVNSQDTECRPQIFHEADITCPETIKKVFNKEKPDIVIHTAAWTDVDGCEGEPDKAYKVNTDGTSNVAKLVTSGKTPLIFISTDFVFDGEKRLPYTETDSARPLSVYGKSKWEAEKALQSIVNKYAIVRTSWLYGKGGKNFVDTVIAKGKTQGYLKVVNDQVGCPTYAKDLAGALKVIVENIGISGEEIYHIANRGSCSWYEFASQILKNARLKKVTITPITSMELARPAARPAYSVLDNKKFITASRYKMRRWQEAVAEYIKEDFKH